MKNLSKGFAQIREQILTNIFFPCVHDIVLSVTIVLHPQLFLGDTSKVDLFGLEVALN